MAYTYILEMKLAKSSDTINLKKYHTQINDSVDSYNSASSHSSNKKRIKLIEINNNSILLRLESNIELNAVGKALRFFSQQLIHGIPELSSNITSSGQLFRVNTIGLPMADNPDISIPLQARSIDDSELIKALIDYVCKKRDANTSLYIKKSKAIEKMKQLAIESGLIIIDPKDKANSPS